jgi:hypothetical protein
VLVIILLRLDFLVGLSQLDKGRTQHLQLPMCTFELPIDEPKACSALSSYCDQRYVS